MYVKALIVSVGIAYSMQGASKGSFVIRTLDANDQRLNAVVHLWAQGQGILEGDVCEEKLYNTLTRSMRAHVYKGTVPLCLLAIRNRCLAGMVRISRRVTHDHKIAPCVTRTRDWSPWISGLIVAPAHRGYNVGFRLLLAAHKKLRESGYEKVFQLVDDEQLFWYEQYGYEKIAEDTIGGLRIHIMRYRLATVG
jgi:predicted GNAT family N-acyltransferase